MSNVGIETIAKGSRYRLRCRGQIMTLSAEDCTELLEILYLKRDEFRGVADEQEDEDTRKYMEHYYLGGE